MFVSKIKKKKRVASVILIGLGNKILQSDTYIHLVSSRIFTSNRNKLKKFLSHLLAYKFQTKENMS